MNPPLGIGIHGVVAIQISPVHARSPAATVAFDVEGGPNVAKEETPDALPVGPLGSSGNISMLDVLARGPLDAEAVDLPAEHEVAHADLPVAAPSPAPIWRVAFSFVVRGVFHAVWLMRLLVLPFARHGSVEAGIESLVRDT